MKKIKAKSGISKASHFENVCRYNLITSMACVLLSNRFYHNIGSGNHDSIRQGKIWVFKTRKTTRDRLLCPCSHDGSLWYGIRTTKIVSILNFWSVQGTFPEDRQWGIPKSPPTPIKTNKTNSTRLDWKHTTGGSSNHHWVYVWSWGTAAALRTVPTNSNVFLPRFMIMQEMKILTSADETQKENWGEPRIFQR